MKFLRSIFNKIFGRGPRIAYCEGNETRNWVLTVAAGQRSATWMSLHEGKKNTLALYANGKLYEDRVWLFQDADHLTQWQDAEAAFLNWIGISRGDAILRGQQELVLARL